MKKDWMRIISLISRGARYQLEVGIALVAIIPLLCFCFIAFGVLWPARQAARLDPIEALKYE